MSARTRAFIAPYGGRISRVGCTPARTKVRLVPAIEARTCWSEREGRLSCAQPVVADEEAGALDETGQARDAPGPGCRP
ncbi:hypothetical protein [Nocardioides convexus]|uniref:hypothetical protein n=1 Tax=Nocardioides convexus TaxID=2712224 RepID=UPI002418506C|nr:hypothetical protein [Nocardioides convexus]